MGMTGHVMSVGRLDFNSEGLLLLTNNGMLKRYLELPAQALRRVYRVRVFGLLTPQKVAALAKGMLVKGQRYRPVHLRMDPVKHAATALLPREEGEGRGAEEKYRRTNQWVEMTLSEGKNREIRHLMAALNLKTSRIIRVSYGPYRLHSLPPGDVVEVPIDAKLWKGFRAFEQAEQKRQGGEGAMPAESSTHEKKQTKTNKQHSKSILKTKMNDQ